MLTKKQRDLLLLIHKRMTSESVAPSFEEMKNELGLKSKSGIHRLISALVERGYLERMPHRARAITVKRLPEGYVAAGGGGDDGTSPPPANDAARASNAGSFASQMVNTIADTFLSVPLMGKIAAGTPIEAIRDEGNSIDIPPTLVGRGEHYALRVEGDSMIKAGIHDRDIVVIQRTDAAENGAIVVALVDGHEVTLKRFRRAGNRIILEPENDDYEPRMLEPDRVRIQGRLVSLMRTYH